MMPEHDFVELSVRSAICPAAETTWPRPDFSKVSLKGEKPHMEVGDPHWDAMYQAVNAARDRTLKTLGAIAAVEADKTLSATGKLEKKKGIAERAITALETSQHLVKARKVVAEQVARWDKTLGLAPRPPEDAAAAMLHTEIRSRIASMKPGERLVFINSHITECADAILGAPAFLSGLTSAEIGVVKQRVEACANPEIAAAKATTVAALADLERGWRNASNQIRERGGLEKPMGGGNGVTEA